MQPRRVLAVLAAGAVAAPATAAAPALAHSGNAPTAAAAATGDKTIVEIAAGDRRFTTLVKLVKSAGLAETLSGGSFTVFAPTNAAFAKVPKKTLNALAKDKAKLKAVLTYHVVAGEVPASKVVKLKSAKTVNGTSVKISVRGKTVRLNRTAKVTQTDIMASNGIIHVINRVLIPPKG